jgi:hypothetical protein
MIKGMINFFNFLIRFFFSDMRLYGILLLALIRWHGDSECEMQSGVIGSGFLLLELGLD